MKLEKKQVFKFLRYLLLVMAGNLIASSATVFFIVPNELSIGGTTGLGIFIEHFYAGSGVAFIVFLLNAALYLVGVFFLGKKFALSTLLGTVTYPAFMQLWELIYVNLMHSQPITEDTLLAAVCAGLLMGVGISIVIRQGSSTGGSDIPALILNKYFGIPVSVSLWVVDLIVIILQGFVTSLQTVLYGLMTVLTYSVVIDAVMPIGLRKNQVKIISEKYKEIRETIINELNLGVTVLYGQTGFLQEKCHMLLIVVSKRNLVRLKNAVQVIDPNAFMMVSVVSEARGRGFTSERIYLPRSKSTVDLQEVTFGESQANDQPPYTEGEI